MAGVDENLVFAPATELKKLIASKEVSPSILTLRSHLIWH